MDMSKRNKHHLYCGQGGFYSWEQLILFPQRKVLSVTSVWEKVKKKKALSINLAVLLAPLVPACGRNSNE